MRLKELIFGFLVMMSTSQMSSQEIFGRFEYKTTTAYGKVVGDEIFPMDKAPWANGKIIDKGIALDSVKILCPSKPQLILGLGGAYEESWKDQKPYNSVRWFLKPPSSAASPNDTISIPMAVDALKVEVELTIIIGKTIKNATVEEAEKAIFGYTIGNDIVGSTASFHEKEGEPNDQKDPLLGPGLKIGDGFAPFGPFIHTNFDWKNRDRTIIITDQQGNEKVNTTHSTSKLIYPPAKILSDLSKVLTLSPGDVVMTGTNKAYVVNDGDEVTIAIDGLGSMTNLIKED